jgi:hypothetical protein
MKDLKTEIEKYLEEILDKGRNLLYNSRRFTLFLIGFIFLATIAFPQLMMLVFATSVVFVFIKGLILLILMINNR